MKLTLRSLKHILHEAALHQVDPFISIHNLRSTRISALNEEAETGDAPSHLEGASGESLDEQVDRYLIEYETDAKKSDTATVSTTQMEAADWSDIVRGVLTEAEGDDDKKDDTKDAEGVPGKLGLDHLDVAKFADDVVRLIDNYDSLLEVRNTLVRRARGFLEKSYDEDVVKAFADVLRDDHGIVPGKDEAAVAAEKSPAPPADRSEGGGEATAGG